MSEACFYPDGYTRDGYVKANPGLHGAVAFTYRPTTYEERKREFAKLNKSGMVSSESHQQAAARLVAFLASKVLTWDIVHPVTGEAIPVDTKTLPRVPPEILLKMELILLGIEKSDPRPDATEGEEPDAEADAKN